MKDPYLGSSKKSSTYMCKMCPFTTSARSILKKHMEYLHPASCIDPFGSHLRLEKRKGSIMEESLDFGSRTKQLIKQSSTFPKNSVLKQDVKRSFGSASQSSNFGKLHKRPYRIQKARKSVSQSSVSVCNLSSPDETLLIRNSSDQKLKKLSSGSKAES